MATARIRISKFRDLSSVSRVPSGFDGGPRGRTFGWRGAHKSLDRVLIYILNEMQAATTDDQPLAILTATKTVHFHLAAVVRDQLAIFACA